MDFKDIKGQEFVKRGVEVAVTGGFALVLIGSKDSGKTMFEDRIKTLTNKKIMVIKALPCPCGNFTHPHSECKCSARKLQGHQMTVQEIIRTRELKETPFIQLEVPSLKYDQLPRRRKGELSAKIRERIEAVKLTKYDRIDDIELRKEAEELLKTAILELGISARAYDSILKISRVVADMDGCFECPVESWHISEAIGYRCLDRAMWTS